VEPMSEPYTIIDAIREEIDTLKELETVYEKEEKFLLLSDYQRQRRSLERILNRFEKGYEYYMGINNEGNAKLISICCENILHFAKPKKTTT
jgi:hypothetical protein